MTEGKPYKNIIRAYGSGDFKRMIFYFKDNNRKHRQFDIPYERLAEILIAESRGELHIMKQAFPKNEAS
jgi:hypothetical protein